MACCFLYSTVFALVLCIFNIFHATTCFDRAYFSVWEHFNLTLAILDSIETRSGQEWSTYSLLIIFGSFRLYQMVCGQRKNYSFTNHKLLHVVWPWFVVFLLNFPVFFSSYYKYLMQFKRKIAIRLLFVQIYNKSIELNGQKVKWMMKRATYSTVKTIKHIFISKCFCNYEQVKLKLNSVWKTLYLFPVFNPQL